MYHSVTAAATEYQPYLGVGKCCLEVAVALVGSTAVLTPFTKCVRHYFYAVALVAKYSCSIVYDIGFYFACR